MFLEKWTLGTVQSVFGIYKQKLAISQNNIQKIFSNYI